MWADLLERSGEVVDELERRLPDILFIGVLVGLEPVAVVVLGEILEEALG